MSQKQITALIIIFLYMIATIAIGLIVSKMKSKKKASQSNEDFLMAGKSLGPLTLAGTLFAANTGGASTTGIATNVFQYGLSASWYVIAGGIGFILVSFIAPYFRPVSYTHLTLPTGGCFHGSSNHWETLRKTVSYGNGIYIDCSTFYGNWGPDHCNSIHY